MKKITVYRVCAESIVFAAVAFCLPVEGSAQLQTQLPGASIPQFVDPVPELPVVDGTSPVELHMREFQAQVLSTGTFAPGIAPSTWVWGFVSGPAIPALPQPSYLGPTVIARRGVPTEVKYVNDLGNTTSSRLLAYTQSTDQTIHWADPLNGGANACAEQAMMAVEGGMIEFPTPSCAQHYAGSIPASVHLHGAEVPPVIDGNPESWFTSDGLRKGAAFYSLDGVNATNYAIYRYPNGDEAEPLWYHDHTLGVTRLNVYAGLAGAYLLVDPPNDPPNLPAAAPLIIQDRMFDTNGELFFPAGPSVAPNPQHPYWEPEFFGDAMLVNGRTWPFMNVEAKRYRFVFLNASNARALDLKLKKQNGNGSVPSMWQVATDGGYLDLPVQIGRSRNAPMDSLLLLPAERAEIIIDFSTLSPGSTLLLENSANTPYPDGTPPSRSTTARVMQFRIGPSTAPDTSYDPASGLPLGGSPLVRLTDPVTGTLAPGVTVNKVRQLTLNEANGDPSTVNGVDYPGGSLGLFINNTRWSGESPRTTNDFTPLPLGGGEQNFFTELPEEGSTELWEIVNLTMDAHPIHIHLIQFQVVNRQEFRENHYLAAYHAAFPGGQYIPGFGPPLHYSATLNTLSGGKDGGNPDITPYLETRVKPPEPNEAGWKDTVVMYPGEVTRIVMRWSPTELPLNTDASALSYAFDPNAGGIGYVEHCHILDHEDNEMMRPLAVQPNSSAPRTVVQGIDY